jgi:Flp pilus assembly protein CpaB
MSRRRRALGFLLLAIIAAAGAAVIADRYGARAARGYGPLRPVVVVGTGVAAGRRLGAREISSVLIVRRVPAQFVPPGALAAPEEALGLLTRTSLPAGSYLLAGQLGVARKEKAPPGYLGDRRPVEIVVSGADALLTTGPAPAGSKVDVVVTSEPAGAGPGRTYVAAAQVPLLALRPGPEGPGPGAGTSATLALTKRQALRLIAAESFARQVTLLSGG